MAFSNTYDTTSPGSAASNREDLIDAMSLLAPQETAFLSLSPKNKAEATVHSWSVDSLADPAATAVNEGADVTAYVDKFANVARLSNYVTKRRRSYMVSDIQQAVESAGPQKLARAEMKAVKEVKRDIEMTMLGTQDRAAGDGAGTASQARGFGDWIDSAGPSDVPATYRTPAASIHASSTFTETVFNNLITSIYRVNGNTNDLTCIADTALRRVISDFALTSGSTNTNYRHITQSAADKGIKLQVETYQSDHGMISIVNMNPVCAPDTTNKDTGYLINFDYVGVSDLIALGSTPVPNLGGGERGYVDWVGTFECLHPGAHGKITVLT